MEKLRTLKKEIKNALSLFWSHREGLIAHHPNCDKFEDDVYHVKGRRLCVGCFTAYPIAITIIIIGVIGIFSYSYKTLLLIGFLSGVTQFLSLTRLSDVRLGKIVIKIFLGIGIGFFTLGIFSLPLHLIFRLLIFFICLNITGFFSFLRIKKIENICQNCEYKQDWRNCPAFEEKK